MTRRVASRLYPGWKLHDGFPGAFWWDPPIELIPRRPVPSSSEVHVIQRHYVDGLIDLEELEYELQVSPCMTHGCAESDPFPYPWEAPNPSFMERPIGQWPFVLVYVVLVLAFAGAMALMVFGMP